MKLGVMADSHDNVPMVRRAVELFNRRGVDLVIHAGDFVAPFAVAPLAGLDCRVVAVFGNNDGERVVLAKKFEAIGEVHPNLAETELGGRRIAAMHYPELAEPIAASFCASTTRSPSLLPNTATTLQSRPASGATAKGAMKSPAWITRSTPRSLNSSTARCTIGTLS